MSKSLKTLSRIQKFKIDEQRKILAERMDKEAEIMNNIRLADERYNTEKDFTQNNPNVGDFGAYTKRYLELRRELENSLLAVRQEIEIIRDKISDMFKEQKTFEIVERERKLAEQHEQEQKDQKMLDEIGTNAYIKHNSD